MNTRAVAGAMSSRGPRRPPGLAGAELLKLRKRRGLVAVTGVLTVAPALVAFGVLVLLHSTSPEDHGPAGGTVNYGNAVQLVASLGGIAVLLVGVTTGSADLRAGVFRELVATGRPRLALFGARIPGGLAFLAPFFVAAFGVVATASVALAGSLQRPGATLVVEGAAWLALAVAANYAFALGVASLVRSGTIAIAVLLAWSFVVVPALRAANALGGSRDWLLPVALDRLQPIEAVSGGAHSAVGIAVGSIVLWSIVPLALGAWRTAHADV